MTFTSVNRSEMINRLTAVQFDVLVIGGGITGAGIAFDASSRGMQTALVEMQDFAAGTSSRSTKLVHGGLRYLKQLEVKMVAEVGKERAILYENGPHVTKPEWMMLPIHKGGTFGKISTSIGLNVYDYLAGVRKAERRQMLSITETLEKEPLIKRSGLKGSGYYVEYRTDDARLTIEVVKAALDYGAVACNYVKVIELIYEKQKVIGAIVQDQLTKEIHQIYAKKVINAAGPWVDFVREMDHSKQGKTIKLSKGVHIVVNQTKFPLKQAIYFDTPDGRMMFAIPREGKTYVGTTDTFFEQDPLNPVMTESDLDYILKSISYMFPEVRITPKDLESSWAGVRPLINEEGKGPSEISRRDEIWESNSGLLTIAGGKLTGYRKMAETIVNIVTVKLQKEEKQGYLVCQTRTLPISGGDIGGSRHFEPYVRKQLAEGMAIGLTEKEAEQLARKYGSNVQQVFQLLEKNKREAETFGLPLWLFAMLIYGIESEMVVTPLDFFARRTGAILFDIELVQKWKYIVIDYMEHKCNWPTHVKEQYLHELEEALHAAATPAIDDRQQFI